MVPERLQVVRDPSGATRTSTSLMTSARVYVSDAGPTESLQPAGSGCEADGVNHDDGTGWRIV
uniref:Unannotated protein n=1 Tax=freshwater metagenome TaxID=449393 RepID=A0A6J7MD01_9ZZZZ